MTKRELLTMLSKLPLDSDDYEIVLSSDGEGNSFSPLADFSIGLYVPDTTYSGEFYMEEEAKECLEPDDEFKKCVVLWPTN